MSNDPKHPSDPTRKQGGSAGGDKPATTKGPGLTTGEPERREFSDKSADASKHADSKDKGSAKPKVQGGSGGHHDFSGNRPDTSSDSTTGGPSAIR